MKQKLPRLYGITVWDLRPLLSCCWGYSLGLFTFLTASCSTTAPRRMNWSSISRKFRPVRWWQHRAQCHVSVPFTRLRLTGTVLRCAGSGWLFEAIWQGRQRCLVQGRIARSDARRGVRFVEFPWDGPSWSTFGRNSEGTRKELGRSVDSRVLRGSCNLRPGRECQELQVGEVARKRPEIFKFPKPTNWKKNVFHLPFFSCFFHFPNLNS